MPRPTVSRCYERPASLRGPYRFGPSFTHPSASAAPAPASASLGVATAGPSRSWAWVCSGPFRTSFRMLPGCCEYPPRRRGPQRRTQGPRRPYGRDDQPDCGQRIAQADHAILSLAQTARRAGIGRRSRGGSVRLLAGGFVGSCGLHPGLLSLGLRELPVFKPLAPGVEHPAIIGPACLQARAQDIYAPLGGFRCGFRNDGAGRYRISECSGFDADVALACRTVSRKCMTVNSHVLSPRCDRAKELR